MKILHIAPFNIAGVPITFVKAERRLGHDSRLVTLARDGRNYEEDCCLELPFLNSFSTQFTKFLFSDPNKRTVDNTVKTFEMIPPKWQPYGWLEKSLIGFRERIWKSKIRKFMDEIDFWSFDVYQLDGGLEFFRNGATVKRLKEMGKKVICCYTGSDLRTRGAIPEIDAASDLNVTLEFDHLLLHPSIEHVFFPIDISGFEVREDSESNVINIGHAPTNRQAKGSEQIISTIGELQRSYPVELILIENLPHGVALKRKSQCHIFVDQIGDLGYGINSLEALAMGIPTCSCLSPGFEAGYPDHPFVMVDEHNIKAKLEELIQHRSLRLEKAKAGREWVQRHHDSEKVVEQIHTLAGLVDKSCVQTLDL
ncbi:glycosyltransferase family 1 protein [candidate division KSB1 bacterium]|nr:glycosyltransferase family 1 protein [candidate division KSB1 bacterium]NIR68825.1 glycosyltransferase family 1 protein [candidate division KSB1 bacterium]NIS27188.1 glycosyltransferase family 1 protein [candidate division KSB1 bacterium]NIT74073.1 glycosyltransferase family 1 protein [candidate division KSB1 bacterium]NIU26938.1 glycosyltransferase family 1 protein [candidate division KSB1 bacterium]